MSSHGDAMVAREPLAHLLDRLPDRYPYSCQWEITWRCNLRCVMCYTDCFNRPELVREELTTEDALRILDELARAGCVELCFTGGEPFARTDFLELYRHAAAHGFLVTIFSNGTLITEAVADRLAELPPHRIEISLHGHARGTFEAVTQGRGSFERCWTGIRLLRERALPVTLKSTALSLNRHELLALKRAVQDLGMAYKLGEELRPALDGSETPRRWALTEEELRELNRRDPELWEEACRRNAQEPPACRSGLRSFHIDPCGRLQLCSGNRRQAYDLRRGSFAEGFYHHLPTFPCEWKAPTAHPLIQLERSHA